MEEFTYEQIRVKALKQGVKDNKVHIGLWANLNNYLKTRRVSQQKGSQDILWNCLLLQDGTREERFNVYQ